MCGIAGSFGGGSSVDFTTRALGSLASRGPDGRGVWRSVDGTTVLVHTRLAILDPTQSSAQPMGFKRERGVGEHAENVLSSPGHREFSSVLVFNGEIYNYRELRAELEAKGETFVSDGDTEVLMRLLVREGEACLPRLAGMFAFAYWDDEKRCALLARDPFGIKPLYFRDDGGVLSFASGSRVLRRADDAPDPSACFHYFLWGSVSDPQTFHLPIRQLPAGHLLKWQDGTCSIERWHRLTFGNRVKGAGLRTSANEAAKLTRAALRESIGRHLVSDVPVGIFLSGGLDSTALVALVRSALGAQADIRTFSIGFDDPEFDESDVARRTAEHFGTNHTEWKMSEEEGATEIAAFLGAIDQPGIDGFNTWCVSKLASREGMKVVLSGLGGDEIFSGYATFDRVPQFRNWYRRLGPLRTIAAKMLDSSPPGSRWRRLAQFFRGKGDWLAAYHVQRGIFTRDEALLLADQLTGKEVLNEKESDASEFPEDPQDVISFLELTRYMRHQLLRDSDVYSMAHGLELRVPFVDVRLFDAIAPLPASIRLRPGKQLLIKAVPEIPEWVRNRPKQGFRFPFQTWMERRFGEVLADARDRAPVPLRAWYRTWAVAAAMQVLENAAPRGAEQ